MLRASISEQEEKEELLHSRMTSAAFTDALLVPEIHRGVKMIRQKMIIIVRPDGMR